MIARLRTAAWMAAVLCALAGSAGGQQNECRDIASQLLKSSGVGRNILLTGNFADITANAVCLVQANAASPKLQQALAPQRTAVWNAFNNFSGSEQQGASSSAGASTNAVSKPSGPTALAEEFGGANVTSGTSSLTVQWAPGSMFTNMAMTGADYLCVPGVARKGCVSAQLLKRLAPLTLKITANTSSGATSTAGTASGASSSGAAPVTVNSKGSSGPGFSGLTAQYVIYGSKRQAGVTPVTKSAVPATAAAFVTEMNQANALTTALMKCDAWAQWKAAAIAAVQKTLPAAATAEPSSDAIQATQHAIEEAYQELLTEMLASKGCANSVKGIQQFMAAVLEAEAYEEYVAMQQNSGTPEVALEYDLNTPQNQPSYSTVRFTGNWQFGKSVKKDSSAAAKGTTATSCAANGEKTVACQVAKFATSQAAVVTAASTNSVAPGSTAKPAAAAAKTLAAATAQPGSLTLTGTTAIYNTEPPSSVPSASHLRDFQAGAEFSWLFSPSSDSSAVRTFLGPMTASLAYSYQDQTSPAILTGPALTSFTGLSSSTTSAYTKRGPIHLGQVRLGFGTGSTATFPLAFTYTNRTELIAHPSWGVQFGVTYNLTSLFSPKASGS